MTRDTVNVPRERVEAFLKAWVGRSGNGNIIYGMGMEDDVLELTVSDLRAMLAAAPKAEPDVCPRPLYDWMMERGIWPDDGPAEWSDVIQALNDHENELTQPEAPKVEQEPVANPLVFGLGALVVDHGKYGGEPAVFVAKAKAAGRVGELTGRDYFDRESLQPGELVLQFPTDTQAKSVADALVGSPAPASDELLGALEKLVRDWHEDELTTVDVFNGIDALIAKHKGPQS